MARIKITSKTIEAKLVKWSQGQEIIDELIFYKNEIETDVWIQLAWNLANIIIEVLPDTVAGFMKIVYKEKL